MPNTFPMLQPLLPFDVDGYLEFPGSVPALFLTYEFRTTKQKADVRFIPNGCIDLLIPISFPEHTAVTNASPAAAPLVLVGAAACLTTVRFHPDTRYFGIRFSPGAFYWNKPMLPSELSGSVRYYDAPESYSPILPKNLARFESIGKRTAYLADSVLPCLKKTCLSPAVVHIINRITQTSGSIRIEDLADELSYSARHINRLFLDSLGYGPKIFCKYVRLQTVLLEIKKMPGRGSQSYLQDVCYSDQAHFQREFKKFTGITPGQYMRLISSHAR